MWQWMSQWMGPGWGPMGGMMFFGGFFWIVILAFIVLAVSWAVRGQGAGPGQSGTKTALDILQERYAKGEVQRDEFLEKKKDLGG